MIRSLTQFATLFAATLAVASNLAVAAPPNVIDVLADDLGYGDLGCYGQQQLAIPNLDRMAADGIRFTHHYAGSTVCAPSRCVLLTGKHIGHAWVRGNQGGLIQGDALPIAKMLRKAVYTTGCVGKWGVGHPPPLDDPARHGFDSFYGYVNMWEFSEKGGKQAVLKGRWKGFRLDWRDQPDCPLQLFDLEQDPAETKDVAAQHPEVVRTLDAIMDREHVAPESRSAP